MMKSRTAVVLCDGRFHGTLATARTLGRHGIPVLVADSSCMAPAIWSNAIARRLRSPPARSTERFIAWAQAVGRANNRPVIYGTSDDVSLVLAMHRNVLEEYFLFYQPELASLLALLDKSSLLRHARAAGLDMPDTWLPGSDTEADQVIREQDGPLLIKPRTQSLLRTHAKGAIVQGGGGDGGRAYADFRRHNVLSPQIAAHFPDWTWPMIQRYHPEAIDSVYSIAGFRDRVGHSLVMRAARKVLQQPRQLGTGLCFEAAPVDAALGDGVQRLLESIGYFGVFEAEFIQLGGRALLIDLNGRLYNQLAFDIARGLPLPMLFYEGALGHDATVAEMMAAVPAETSTGPRAFCNRSSLSTFVGLRRFLGTMSKQDITRWKAWRAADTDTVIDAVADREDPLPEVLYFIHEFSSSILHPRAFIRNTGFDQL